ncbi:MAG: mechanosensitive ion channel family protein [Chloroflexota bacterium]|nr:mechanosensitive ion channel family protein [Chloroflexota bacterium]
MESVLSVFGLSVPSLMAIAVSLSIIVVTLVIVIVVYAGIFPLIIRIGKFAPSSFGRMVIQGLKVPLVLYLGLLGVYLSITLPFGIGATEAAIVNKAATLVAIVIGVMAVSVITSRGCLWYIVNIAPKTPTILDDRLMPLMRRVAVIVILGVGILQILDQLGINISPLLAGLGLGGLAVALALQPTLSNLFSGTYVMTEGVVSQGDYIEMEDGTSGYVIDVSWRSTRLRTRENNLIVVPNSRFAESIITNFQSPTLAVNIVVTCGVSYDSDLDHVESISREVMSEVLASDVNSVASYGSWFGFDNFGESNVDFWLFMQAQNRIASFELKSNLMKSLYKRFSEEGIVINYPMRTLQFPDEFFNRDSVVGHDSNQEV